MYQIAISIYLIGVAIASLFNEKVRKMWRGERNAIRTIKHRMNEMKAAMTDSADSEMKFIWVHAASLGEFEQGRPIIEHIRRDHPDYKILLTFFSPSGYEVRKNYDGADIVTYLPIDTIRNARRFLRTIHPVCAIFIKYEFWYNYLHILKHRNIPVYSVSSIFRPNQIFFRWYGRGYANVLRCVTHYFVQNEESRKLLAENLGITAVTVTGDTRFDRVIDIAHESKEIPVVEQWLTALRKETEGAASSAHEGKTAKPRVFVAGSSWQPDEEVFIPWFKGRKEWSLIIAPHVIAEEHLRQIEQLLDANGIGSIRYTDIRDGKATLSIDTPAALILNCFGLLSSVYRYADITYVGGGFGVGIHNLPEAAVWKKPVIFGPNNARFREAQHLKSCGGGFEIADSSAFHQTMERLLSSPEFLNEASAAAGNYIRNNAGATDAIVSGLSGLS